MGKDRFSFEDKNEIMSRVERDFGMFLGVENEVNFVVNNDFNVLKTIKEILENAEKR